MSTAHKIPTYVAETITVNTGVDPTGPVTRRARQAVCHKCKRAILRGLDADTAAWDAHVDPTPLTELGEAVAQLSGLGTWERHPDGGRLVLDYRDGWRIAARPAGKTPGEDVHAAHDCGRTWAIPATQTTSQIAARYFNRPVDPPF